MPIGFGKKTENHAARWAYTSCPTTSQRAFRRFA
jgi:hypothetical protein